MSTSSLFGDPEWSDVVVDSIRDLYPRKEDRTKERKRIREALNRIVGGEIDGKQRTPEQAILYLREKTESARQQFAGRERQYIPHASTFYNQKRYLRIQQVLSIDGLSHERITMALNILQAYPNVGTIKPDELQAHAALVLAVDKEIGELTIPPDNRDDAYNYLLGKTKEYAEAVAHWPPEEMKYLSGVVKFFELKRYKQNGRFWQRGQSSNGFEAERRQIRRVFSDR